MQVGPLSHQLGQDAFVWWIGVVEGRAQDPLQVGRAKVRIFGWHDKDLDSLSTQELPWAYPILPVTHSNGIPNYREGDWVIGFFMDSHLGQLPVIWGTLPGIPQPAQT